MNERLVTSSIRLATFSPGLFGLIKAGLVSGFAFIFTTSIGVLICLFGVWFGEWAVVGVLGGPTLFFVAAVGLYLRKSKVSWSLGRSGLTQQVNTPWYTSYATIDADDVVSWQANSKGVEIVGKQAIRIPAEAIATEVAEAAIAEWLGETRSYERGKKIWAYVVMLWSLTVVALTAMILPFLLASDESILQPEWLGGALLLLLTIPAVVKLEERSNPLRWGTVVRGPVKAENRTIEQHAGSDTKTHVLDLDAESESELAQVSELRKL